MTVYLPLEYDPGAVGCSVPPKPTLAPIGEAHRHKAEEKRLMGKVARQEMGNRVSYSLTVDYPLIGVTYLLHWKPVAARSAAGSASDPAADLPGSPSLGARSPAPRQPTSKAGATIPTLRPDLRRRHHLAPAAQPEQPPFSAGDCGV